MGKFITLFCLVSLSSPTVVEARRHATRSVFQGRQAKKQRTLRRQPYQVRGNRARQLLGRPLPLRQMKAVHAAHMSGSGQRGADGVRQAGIGNYSWKQIKRKASILKTAGFNKRERRQLISAGLVGKYSYNATVPAVYLRLSRSKANRLAQVIGQQLGVTISTVNLAKKGWVSDTYSMTVDAPNRALAKAAAELWSSRAKDHTW